MRMILMTQEESRITVSQGHKGVLGKGVDTHREERRRQGGWGKASPFPMPTASTLEGQLALKPQPRPPPRLAMMEGAWGFRHPMGKT